MKIIFIIGSTYKENQQGLKRYYYNAIVLYRMAIYGRIQLKDTMIQTDDVKT